MSLKQVRRWIGTDEQEGDTMDNTTNTALKPSQFVRYTEALADGLKKRIDYSISEQFDTVQMSIRMAQYIHALLSMEVDTRPMTFAEMCRILNLAGNNVWLERSILGLPKELHLARFVGQSGNDDGVVFEIDGNIEIHSGPEYGYSWRIWLFKPDEETRQSVPWEPATAPFEKA